MIGSMILLSAALASTAPVEVSAPRPDSIDVGYEDLRAGRAEAAIEHIKANRLVSADDPSALINLGAAHARIGKPKQAQAYYLAAIASRDRYDVQLSDGRWMDTRRAARLALETQTQGGSFALR